MSASWAIPGLRRRFWILWPQRVSSFRRPSLPAHRPTTRFLRFCLALSLGAWPRCSRACPRRTYARVGSQTCGVCDGCVLLREIRIFRRAGVTSQGFETFRDYLDDGFRADRGAGDQPATGDGWASQANGKLQRWRPAMGPFGILYDELYFRYCQRVTPVPSSLDALRRFPAADVIVDHACNWLASVGDQPFFLWLHLMDPHSPYYPKKEALRLMGRDAVMPAHARYLNSYWNRSDIGPRRFESRRDEIVAFTMRASAGPMSKCAGWWSHCADRIVGMTASSRLTADHGEEFLEHGGRYHPPSNLMEELIHVPLIVRVPGSRRSKGVKVTFQLDPSRTDVAGLCGIGRSERISGTSYWPALQRGEDFGDAAISECVAGCTNPFRADDRHRAASARDSRIPLQAGAAFRSCSGKSLRSGGRSGRTVCACSRDAKAGTPASARNRPRTLAAVERTTRLAVRG